MSINLNDIINYGSCKFKVVKFATSEDVNYLLNNSFFIGMIVPYCGNNSIPNGYLICDGSEISRTTYVDLFNVIGTTYGVGNESTTFNVPNFTDKFMEGNFIAGINKNAGLPNITGQCAIASDTASAFSSIKTTGAFCSASTISNNGYRPNYLQGGSGKDFAINASLSSSIYGNSSTVQPPAVTVRFLIKAFNA